MIHWSRVSELRQEVGEEDFGEVVDLFLEEVEEVIDRLRTNVDLERLEEDLHFLKGSALSLGFSAFSELCQDGERRSANGQPETVDLASIITGFAQSKSLFVSQLSGQTGG